MLSRSPRQETSVLCVTGAHDIWFNLDALKFSSMHYNAGQCATVSVLWNLTCVCDSACVCECMCACMHAIECVCACVYICVHVCGWLCVCVYTSVCMRAHVHTCVCVCACMCVCMRVFACVCAWERLQASLSGTLPPNSAITGHLIHPSKSLLEV